MLFVFFVLICYAWMIRFMFCKQKGREQSVYSYPFVYIKWSISPMHYIIRTHRQTAWDDGVAPCVYIAEQKKWTYTESAAYYMFTIQWLMPAPSLTQWQNYPAFSGQVLNQCTPVCWRFKTTLVTVYWDPLLTRATHFRQNDRVRKVPKVCLNFTPSTWSDKIPGLGHDALSLVPEEGTRAF